LWDLRDYVWRISVELPLQKVGVTQLSYDFLLRLWSANTSPMIGDYNDYRDIFQWIDLTNGKLDIKVKITSRN
jgi:hypothetical protein